MKQNNMELIKSIENAEQTIKLYADGTMFRVTVNTEGLETTRLFADWREASSYFDGQAQGN